MYGLLEVLYDKNKQNKFKELYISSDSETQLLIRSTIAESLKDCPRILKSNGFDWLLCSLSSYHKNVDDTIRVYQSIIRTFYSIDFGLLTEDIKWKNLNSIADESLVGISFFRKYIEEMNKRRASPSVEYYSKAGSLAFHRLGYDNIGKDFLGWTSFIEKEIVITSVN